MARPKTLKICTFCTKEVYRIAGHGLCANCYYREKRNGTPDYVKVRSPCHVDGCESLSVAHDYCETHYRRWKRHGVAENERFDRWGHVSKHPLAHSYYWARKTEGVNFHAAWGDFWQFATDIGERPSSRHRLRKIDQGAPLAPGNFKWAPPKFDIPCRNAPERAEYARAHRAAHPRDRKAAHLKKVYGITIDQYDSMCETQGGVCAVCSQPETANHPQTGMPRNLAVDHCHKKGNVRALLCSKCNTGLGSFNDDPALLQAAIDYLTLHTPDVAPPD